MEQKPKLPLLGSGTAASLPQRQQAAAQDLRVCEIVKWIKSAERLSTFSKQALVENAEALAWNLVGASLNTTQIQKLLARIHEFSARSHGLSARRAAPHAFQADEVQLLKVHLVYAAAREKKKVGPLADVLLPAIDKIKDEADYRWFAKFVEAVVAYHRLYRRED
jgi:CRISPR type III-A-associated protein Csm2